MKRMRNGAASLFAAVLLFAMIAAAPGGASAASSNSSNGTANGGNPSAAIVLDGRLGGSTTSFSSVYGKATKTKGTGDIESYTVSGFGLVAAAFRSSKAYEITIAADRLSHKPLTDADPADWTVTNAARFADAIVPTDATYDKPVKNKTKIELIGHSAALAKVFTEKDYTALQVSGKPGDFDVVYNLDTSGNVFSIDASLGNGGTVASSSGTNGPTGSATKTSGANSTGNSAASGQVVHCKDFQTQADAQAYFDAHGGDSNPAVAAMDGDKDGKPCETLP